MTRAQQNRGEIRDDRLRELTIPPNGALFYEVKMPNAAAARCRQHSDKEANAEQRFMAIESFLIHFRNLRDFLYPDGEVRREEDNVIAFHYNPHWHKTDRDWKQCSRFERGRINKMLAHLSYSRGRLAPSWPIEQMRIGIMKRLRDLILGLPAERQTWFIGWPL